MNYQLFEAGSVIMKEGDESDDKMYVIISGDCSVVI
jgi:hypothetical protein